jgi:GTPase SAR1 family protein
LILIGNKTDLAATRVVTTSEADRFASELHFAGFFETSSRDGTNVAQAFTALAGYALASSIAQEDVPPRQATIQNISQTTNCCGGSN